MQKAKQPLEERLAADFRASLEEKLNDWTSEIALALEGVRIQASWFLKDGTRYGLTLCVEDSNFDDIAEPVTLLDLLKAEVENGWAPEYLEAAIRDLRQSLEFLREEYKQHTGESAPE